MYNFLIILLFLMLLIAALIFYLRARLQDASVPVIKSLLPANVPQRVMCIFPHPDDEIVVAGTLLLLEQQKIETILVTLTHGEKGPTGGKVAPEELGNLRIQELQKSASILGIDHQELFKFPDGGIEFFSPMVLKQTILEVIAKYQPSLIITYDEKKGLYGHPDHRLSALFVHEIVKEHQDDPGFPVKAVYAVTVPKNMLEVAMSISPVVREAFRGDAGSLLPLPDFAIRIWRYAKMKSRALHAHWSQHGVMSQFFPFHDRFPTWLYFFVFDREYFAKVDCGGVQKDPSKNNSI